MDKETTEILTEGESMRELTTSRGWRLAKIKLLDKIVELDSISSLETDRDAADMLQEINGRQVVIKMVLDWIKEVEGRSGQHVNNLGLLKVHRQESYRIYKQ